MAQVTDPVLLKELARQGIDPADVDFDQDYASRSLGKRHSPYAKFYTTKTGQAKGRQFAVISGLPMVDADGVKIECGWRVAGINYFSEKNNLFRAKVQGQDVELIIRNDQPDGRKAGDRLSFKPQLFLNGVEQIPSQSVLLPVDHLNSNYLENTIEWDYGICKRRLRIIEGSILGSWVFPAKPAGEVRIKYNQTGDYKLRLGQFKVGDDEELIQSVDFDRLAREGYPVTISDSATYYPDAHVESTSVDGQVYRYVAGGQNFAGIRAGAGTTADPSGVNGNPFYLMMYGVGDAWNYLVRFIALFDTSALPDTATIQSAVVSLYGCAGSILKANVLALNPAPDLNVYSSNPASNTDLVAADYGALGTTAYTDTPFTYANWANAYNAFTAFNAAGLAAISKTGVTKLGFRNANYDVSGTTPSSSVSGETAWLRAYTADQGNGYKPKLVVTYTSFTTYNESLTDGAKAGETPTARAVFGIVVIDGLKGGDSSGGRGTFPKALLDGLKAGDTNQSKLLLALVLADGVKGGDSALSKLLLNLILSDGVKLGDASALLGAIFNLSLTDGTKLGDVTLSQFITNPALTDGIKLGDVLSTTAILNALVLDGVKLGDTPLTRAILNSLITDGIKLGDLSTFILKFAKTLTDGIKVSDLPNTQAILKAIAADGIKVGDSAAHYLLLGLALLDGIKGGDTALAQLIISLSRTDGIKVGDATLTQLLLNMALSDGTRLGDTTIHSLLLNLVLGDGIKLGDTALLSGVIYNLYLTDGITLSDALILLAILRSRRYGEGAPSDTGAGTTKPIGSGRYG